MIEILSCYGITLNELDKIKEFKNIAGYACLEGRYEIAKFLIENGVDVSEVYQTRSWHHSFANQAIIGKD